MNIEFLTPFFESHFFAALRILAFLYVVVLILDIGILLSFRNLREDWNKNFYGTDIAPLASRGASRKRWNAIRDRLKTENLSEYKVAVLEADMMVDEILSEIGFKEGDMLQKIEAMAQIDPKDAENLREAHAVRNRIVFERDFEITHDGAEEVLAKYGGFLGKIGAL